MTLPGSTAGRLRSRGGWSLAAVALSIVLAAAPAVASAAEGSPWRDPDQHFFQPFLGDLPSELESSAKAGKKGLLVVYEMDGCPFCVWLHKTALRETVVQDYYRRQFGIIRIDIRGGAPVKGFDGKTVVESSFASQQKVKGTPTCVFYDLQGKETHRFTGAPRDRREFMLLGEYVADGHYRTMPFPSFRQSKTGS